MRYLGSYWELVGSAGVVPFVQRDESRASVLIEGNYSSIGQLQAFAVITGIVYRQQRESAPYPFVHHA
jgi:hypothetical protein